MSKLYKKNLVYLKNLCSDFYDKVINLDEINVYTCKSKTGKLNAFKNVYGKKYYINSTYDPIDQAKYISKDALKDKPDIVVIFGLGFAYELKEMQKLNHRIRYIIIEPDLEVLKTMLENISLESFFNEYYKLTLILETDVTVINAHFQNTLNIEKSTNIKFVVLPYYRQLYEDLINESFKLFKESISYFKVNTMTILYTDRQWILNYARNMQYLYETIDIMALKDDLENVPAIIVGAGPSLEYNLEHLKKVGDKALIVGAGTGTRILDKNGIKAHALGVMDGGELNNKLYSDLGINKDSNLFYSFQVFNTVPSKFNGNKFLMEQVAMDYYIIKNLYNRKNINVFSGASITNVLAHTLARLGCNPIIFLGQDLSSRDEKIGYAQNLGVGHYRFDRETINVQGEKVYTNDSFLSMKMSMETVIRNNNQIKYLNGTKYGLHIDGSEDIDFNGYVVDKLLSRKDYDFDSIFDNYSKLEDTYKENIDKFVIKYFKSITSIKDILKECVDIIDNNYRENIKNERISKLEEKLKGIEEYNLLLVNNFQDTIDILFKVKDYWDGKKQKYLYYLDMCNLMANAIYGLFDFYEIKQNDLEVE